MRSRDEESSIPRLIRFCRVHDRLFRAARACSQCLADANAPARGIAGAVRGGMTS